MGFSVSGSAAIVFAGMFIAFGMFHTATTNGFERVSDARAESADDVLEQRNTDLAVESVTYNASGNDKLVVSVNNTGSTEQSVEGTHLVVDNDLYAKADWDTYDVDGDASTDLWLPGEQLTVEITLANEPGRVKVVTEPGVADSEVV